MTGPARRPCQGLYIDPACDALESVTGEPSTSPTTKPRSAKKSRVTELIVLIESGLLATWSLTWLGVATAQSDVDRVRWEFWFPSHANTVGVVDMATTAAVVMSIVAMLTIVTMAAVGYLRAPRPRRRGFGVARPTMVAALTMLPLTGSMPVQFAAFQQTQGWAGDGHGLELIVTYGPFFALLVGMLLLLGTKEFVDPS